MKMKLSLNGLTALIIFFISLAIEVPTNAQLNLPIEKHPFPQGKGNSDLPYVNESTGELNYTLPLVTLSDGIVPLNITAVNSGSGIKANPRNTVLGIGWELSTGISLKRAIMDLPDEFEYYDEDNLLQQTGWMYLAESDNVADRITNFMNTSNQSQSGNLNKNSDFYNALMNLTNNYNKAFTDKRRIDGSPDIYIFEFGGNTYPFYFQSYSSSTSAVPLKINSPFSLTRDAAGHFSVTQSDGTTYLFWDKNNISTHDKTLSYLTNQNDVRPPLDYSYLFRPYNTYITEWKISTISSPYFENTISFHYREVIDQWVESNDVLGIDGKGNLMTHKTKYRTNSFVGTKTNVLESISYFPYTLTFDYNNSNILDKIHTSSIMSRPEQITKFEYKQLGNEWYVLTQLSNQIDGKMINYTKFAYWPITSPLAGNLNIDKFGYMNEPSSTGEMYNSFPLSFFLGQPDVISANRTWINSQTFANDGVTDISIDGFKLESVRQGSLSSIYHSSGITIDLEFELNMIKSTSTPITNVYAGGLRIKKIEVKGFGKYNDEIKTVTYSYIDTDGFSSGTFTGRDSRYHYFGESKLFDGNIVFNDQFEHFYTFRIFQKNFSGSGDFQGKLFYYQKVTSVFNDELKKCNYYHAEQWLPECPSFYANGYDNIAVQSNNLQTLPVNLPHFGIKNGVLTRTEEFDLAGTLLKRKEITYILQENFSALGGYIAKIISDADCIDCADLNNSSIQNMKNSRVIQFTPVQFKRQAMAISKIETYDRLEGTSKEFFTYNSFYQLSRILTEKGNKKSFVDFIYKNSIPIHGDVSVESETGVLSAFQKFPYDVPFVTIEGAVVGTVEKVQTCNFDVRSIEPWLTKKKLFAKASYVLKNPVLYSNFSLPELHAEIPGAAFFSVDPAFILTSQMKVHNHKILENQNIQGMRSFQQSVFSGTQSAYTIQNSEPGGFYIDNFDGYYPQGLGGGSNSTGTVSYGVFGTELHPVPIHFPYPPPASANRPGFWPELLEGNWLLRIKRLSYSPSIIINESRYQEGVYIGFSYKAITAESFPFTLIVETLDAGGGVTSSLQEPLTVDNITNIFRKKYNSQQLALSGTNSTVRIRFSFGDSDYFLIDDLIFCNQGAKVELFTRNLDEYSYRTTNKWFDGTTTFWNKYLDFTYKIDHLNNILETQKISQSFK